MPKGTVVPLPQHFAGGLVCCKHTNIVFEIMNEWMNRWVTVWMWIVPRINPQENLLGKGWSVEKPVTSVCYIITGINVSHPIEWPSLQIKLETSSRLLGVGRWELKEEEREIGKNWPRWRPDLHAHMSSMYISVLFPDCSVLPYPGTPSGNKGRWLHGEDNQEPEQAFFFLSNC